MLKTSSRRLEDQQMFAWEGEKPIRRYLIITGTVTQTEEASAQEMFVVSVRLEELPESLKLKLLLSWDQKQSSRGILYKRCLRKFRKIHRKIHVPKSFFDKVAALRPTTILKKRLVSVFL